MRNILKLAFQVTIQTIDGLRALPAIARVLQSNHNGLVSVSGALDTMRKLCEALERDHADQMELIEAKRRIAALVESDGKLRLENDRLLSEIARLKADLDAAQEIVA